MAGAISPPPSPFISARHFSWNRTNVPSECALEKTDLWVIPASMPDDGKQLWAPLAMLNDDSGCDWGYDIIKTYWTAFRPFDPATDSSAFAPPRGCSPEAPACGDVCHGDKCTIDGDEGSSNAYCPCASIAFCPQWLV